MVSPAKGNMLVCCGGSKKKRDYDRQIHGGGFWTESVAHCLTRPISSPKSLKASIGLSPILN